MDIKITFPGNAKIDAEIEGFKIQTDQAEESGGDGSAPEPFMFFLASLGTCAGIYVKRFCDRRNIPADDYYLTQRSTFNQEKGIIDTFYIDIHVDETFPEKYDKAIIKTASLCAVKKHLSSEINTIVKVVRS